MASGEMEQPPLCAMAGDVWLNKNGVYLSGKFSRASNPFKFEAPLPSPGRLPAHFWWTFLMHLNLTTKLSNLSRLEKLSDNIAC
jgi:hypothetical protein